MSRAYTPKEIREEFMSAVKQRIFYWSRQEGSDRDKLEGLVHSILCIFDGVTALPGFDIVVQPHPDDKQYHIDNGENWYEPGTVVNNCCLHDMLYERAKKDFT